LLIFWSLWWGENPYKTVKKSVIPSFPRFAWERKQGRFASINKGTQSVGTRLTINTGGVKQLMLLISFDMLRTLDIPGVSLLKPEEWFSAKNEVKAADWILFPEYWQTNALVYAWKKNIFPNIGTYHIGHNKIEMTRAFEAVRPENVPFTRILPCTDNAIEQILDEFTFPFVAKEVRSCRGEGVFLIEDRKNFLDYTRKNEILFAQEYLPITRDLRIVVVGKKVVTGYWREAREGGFHNNISQGGSVNFEDVPESAFRFTEQLAVELGINYAGFDVAEVDGHYFLMEYNVRFGAHALNMRGIRLGGLILEYLHENTVKPDYPRLSKAD